MTLRVAINGFGRIGRNVLRALYENGYRDRIQVVAINDLGDPALNAHLLKHDSVHGHFSHAVSHDDESLSVDGDRISTLAQRDPAQLPWRELKIDLVMEPSRIIVWRMLPLITTPMLTRFLRLLRTGDERRAQMILERVRTVCRGMTPQTWSVDIGIDATPAVQALLDSGQPVSVGDLLRERLDRDERLPALALMHTRGAENVLMPDPERSLQAGDRLLFCGRDGTRHDMEWVLYNRKALEYVVTGIDIPDGAVWRWLRRRRAATAATGHP